MQHIQLSDQLYQEAQSRATEAGFANVDAFVAHVLKHELEDDPVNLDGFFTPERMALIEEAEAQIARGESYTLEQLDSELDKTRAEWLRQHQVEK
jgi:hypothetical protein